MSWKRGPSRIQWSCHQINGRLWSSGWTRHSQVAASTMPCYTAPLATAGLLPTFTPVVTSRDLQWLWSSVKITYLEATPKNHGRAVRSYWKWYTYIADGVTWATKASLQLAFRNVDHCFLLSLRNRILECDVNLALVFIPASDGLRCFQHVFQDVFPLFFFSAASCL